jgi:hypothetical protein
MLIDIIMSRSNMSTVIINPMNTTGISMMEKTLGTIRIPMSMNLWIMNIPTPRISITGMSDR